MKTKNGWTNGAKTIDDRVTAANKEGDRGRVRDYDRSSKRSNESVFMLKSATLPGEVVDLYLVSKCKQLELQLQRSKNYKIFSIAHQAKYLATYVGPRDSSGRPSYMPVFHRDAGVRWPCNVLP